MRVLLFACLFALAACGFHPLYAHPDGGPGMAAALTNVSVATIKDAEGQALRNALLDRMPPSASMPRYVLNITVTETEIGIAIAHDATVTRQQLQTNVHAVLVDMQTQKAVWQQSVFSTSGYNVLNSQFSTLVGEEDARKRNVDDLAQRIVNMLALYFNRSSQ